MERFRTSLLPRLVLALTAMGLLPLAIGLVQLSNQQEVLESEAKSSHQLATRTAGLRLQAGLDVMLGVARSTAEHPAMLSGDRNAMGQVVQGAVSAQPGVLGVGVYDLLGETVMLAQRQDLAAELGAVFGQVPPRGEPPVLGLEIVTADAGPRLRVRHPLPGAVGYVVLIANAEPLAEMLQFPELGDAFRMILVDGDLRVLAGGTPEILEGFPPELLEQARTGKVGSLSKIYRGEGEEGILAGHSRLEIASVPSARWFVLSRQSLDAAQAAADRLRRAAGQASLLAVALTLLLAGGAYATVVKPLRRLATAQRELVGDHPGAGVGGSEIEQLERSFEVLRQRVRDSQDLGEIFLGRYQVTEVVGSGAMGSVFRGWDDKLQRPVALKTVHMDAEEIDRKKLLKSLRDEAAITARIHQPNIVTVYDIEDRGSSAFIAMEFVDGVNLQRLLRVRGHLPPQDAIPIAAGIARGLATAHANFLVHHDVKPANILLGLDGSIKLTDFGVSQSISAATQRQDVICGTPGYLPPECFEGEDYTPAGDLWALGAVLWEAMVGYNPFRGKSLSNTVARTLNTDADPLRSLLPETPQAFSDLIVELLAKESGERPQDGEQVAARLERICAESGLVWLPDLADVIGQKTAATAKPGSASPTQMVPTQRSKARA
ncbi:MAG: serine/threonine-protein kinase [Acidobacteriota bacterium]